VAHTAMLVFSEEIPRRRSRTRSEPRLTIFGVLRVVNDIPQPILRVALFAILAWDFLRAEKHYYFDAASLAHCQNLSAAGLSRPFAPMMPAEIGFGSGVMCKNFTRFPKL
jgi:hypothetical protein